MNDDPYALGLLGQACTRAGEMEEAKKILTRLNEVARSRYVHAYTFALLHLALGNKEEAIDDLERAYREHAGNDIGSIRVDPLLDDLRGKRRFEALAERIVPASQFTGTTASK